MTFVAACGHSEASVEMRYEDENVRLTQKMDKKLHTRPAFDVVFASRGKARTQALRAHLLKAQAASRKAAGTYPDVHPCPGHAVPSARRSSGGGLLPMGAAKAVHQEIRTESNANASF